MRLAQTRQFLDRNRTFQKRIFRMDTQVDESGFALIPSLAEDGAIFIPFLGRSGGQLWPHWPQRLKDQMLRGNCRTCVNGNFKIGQPIPIDIRR